MANRNLQLKIFFLTIIFCGIFGLVKNSHAATINAASCSQTNVTAAIASAAAGDTVNVPAGSCTWNSIDITKGINLIGAGIGNTVITAGTCSLGFTGNFFIQYDPVNYALDTPFRLSGFTFNLNGTCDGIELGITGRTTPFVIQDKVRIDHIRLADPQDYTMWNADPMYGVVDNNIFDNSVYIKNDASAAESFWSASPQNIYTPGGDTNLYYEDNIINLSPSAALVAEAQYAGRYAFRYNTITTTMPSYSLFEMHGHQTSGSMPSSFGMEVYGNRVNAGDNQIILTKTRGGKSFVFNNSVVAGDLSNNAYDGLVTCPAINPAGQMIHDTYWWGTRLDYAGELSYSDISGSVTCDGLSNRPLAGRDVIADDTTPGVTCGTLTACPITCATGQGYWATNQSCADLTGMVGTNPATPISGTLYKCIVTDTWTAFYVPYTYPHPLRDESGDMTPPSAPGGLSVN